MTSHFDWLLYIDVAAHLLTQAGEGFSRSATSRAYYGIFCNIRDVLELHRGKPFSNKRSVHSQVINSLKSDSRPTVVRLGTNLDRLRRERNQADYNTNVTYKTSRGQTALLMAKEIQRELVALI